MRRLHAAVLALYPPAVRERYGEEIVALLEQSRTPMRDLADVAWSALAERAQKLVRTDLPKTPHGLAVASVTILACVAVPVLGFSAAPWTIVPVGLAAGALCARRRNGLGAAIIVIGTVLTLFTAPHLIQLLVGHIGRMAEVTSVTVFAAAVVGLAVLVVALVRRNRRRTALTVAVVGAIALPHLATTTLVLMSGAGPAGNPWTAYWASMLPYRGWSSASGSEFVPVLFDILVWYPALLSFCAAFLLAFCFRATVTSHRDERLPLTLRALYPAYDQPENHREFREP